MPSIDDTAYPRVKQNPTDEELRKIIQAATNKSESFNRFAFGKEGVIATNNRDEQRKFIRYNYLVANCLIFYNVF